MESTTSGLTVDAEPILRLGWYGLGILAVALFVDLFPSRFPALGAKRNPGQERVIQMLMDLVFTSPLICPASPNKKLM